MIAIVALLAATAARSPRRTLRSSRSTTASARATSTRSAGSWRAFVAAAFASLVALVAPDIPHLVGGRAGAGRPPHAALRATSSALSLGFYERNRAGVIISRLTNDVEALDQLVTEGVTSLIQNTLVLIGSAIVLFVLDWRLALATLGGDARDERSHVRSSGGARTKRVPRRPRTARARHGDAGRGHLRACGSSRRSAARMRRTRGSGRSASDYREANMQTVVTSGWYFPFVDFLSTVATAIVLGYGGYLVFDRSVTIGTLVAFIGYLTNFFDPVQQLSQLYNTFLSATAALDKIIEVLDEEPEVLDRPGAVALAGIDGHVRFEDVRFGYGKDSAALPEVLHGIDLDIEPGTTVALVGHTGAGKSTIAKLLARFYDVRGGRITIDGIDVRDVTQALAAPSARDRAAGGLPLRRNGAREHRLRPARGEPGRRRRRRPRPSAPTTSSCGCPTATRRSSASAGRSSRSGSGSSSPSPERCSPTRGSSSSTRPRRPSTSRPSSASRRRSRGSAPAARRSSSPTGSRRSAEPTSSSCSSTASSSSRARTRSSSRAAGRYRSLYGDWAGRGRVNVVGSVSRAGRLLELRARPSAGSTAVPGIGAARQLATGHFGSDFFQGTVPALLPFLVAERGYSYGKVGALVLAAEPGLGVPAAPPRGDRRPHPRDADDARRALPRCLRARRARRSSPRTGLAAAR